MYCETTLVTESSNLVASCRTKSVAARRLVSLSEPSKVATDKLNKVHLRRAPLSDSLKAMFGRMTFSMTWLRVPC